MLKKLLIGFSFFLMSNLTYSQTTADSLLKVGNVFYKKKDYINAGKIWVKASEYANNRISKQLNYFYAAHAFAEGKDSVNAFNCLELAILKNGFNDLPALEDEDTFGFINKSKKWKKLIKSIKPTYSSNPNNAKIVDTDVKNFWISYDMVQKDTANAQSIYQKYYIDKGSLALQDYFVNKMGGNIYSFTYSHRKKDKFYKSIRVNTLKAVEFSKNYKKSFANLKEIYPKAIFPNVYFVIGKLNSAGTVSSNGLILGIDQICRTETTDTTELESWEQHYLTPLSNLSATVAHELIHFQQKEMASDTTLLKAAIVEGMADLIGELISGQSANTKLQQFAKGKEKLIWDKFKVEMYLDKGNNWVGNGDQDKPDWPSDLGYWMGYEICKSYYENSEDKKKAIYEMLHIQDYNKFLKDSKFQYKANAWQ